MLQLFVVTKKSILQDKGAFRWFLMLFVLSFGGVIYNLGTDFKRKVGSQLLSHFTAKD